MNPRLFVFTVNLKWERSQVKSDAPAVKSVRPTTHYYACAVKIKRRELRSLNVIILIKVFRPWLVYSIVLHFLFNFCDKIGYWLLIIRINQLSIRIVWHMAVEEKWVLLQPIISLYETDCTLQLLELRKCKRKNSVRWLNTVKCLRMLLLGNSPASEFYMPTFRDTLSHLHRQVGVKNELG